jgi:FkbM family methyltransferase
MKFLYGYDTAHYVDITHLVFKHCIKDNVIRIPSTDASRANIFGDPFVGVLKHIIVVDNFDNHIMFAHTREVNIPIDLISEELTILTSLKGWYTKVGRFIENPEERLKQLQAQLSIEYGSFQEEFPEQMLAVRYIKQNAKVLEIGGNIGRNTMIIGSILDNPENLVTLESDPIIADQLRHNLKLNNINSHVEASALSLAPLIQSGWDTVPHTESTIPAGWKPVPTISFKKLNDKYNIQFDTLVADCEGALYYILKDDSSILTNIKLVIIENDFKDASHKEFVDNKFKESGFKRVCFQAGGWGPCYNYFYEVWQRDI